MAPLRVAILGTGLSLQAFHYPLITALPEQYVLHSVMERSGRGKAQEICGGDIKVVKTIEEVVGDAEVDVVVVSTPNNTHYPFAKAALENGKHVMVEKPVTPTVAEAEELAALAKSKNLVFCVYQNRRWDADFLTLRKVLDEGTLGPIHEFHSRFDRYRPLPADHKPSGWKETPGEHNEAIYNLGSHVIDQVVTLFGVPERLIARNYDERGVGLDEAFEMTLLYPPQSGAQGPLAVHVGASILSSTPQQRRFLVKGRAGSFEKFGLDPQEPFLRAGKKVRDSGFGEEGEDAWATVSVCKDGQWSSEKRRSEKGWYPAIYESMHEAITSGDVTRLAVQPEQAIWTMRLIEMGNTSSREGRVIDVQKEAK
ncbi:NAD-binding protein [Cutaneotrichosporon oleaginosum]|uniref:NAD-binding protein n=1 Tax=Cutaneotrichosporon oleaginosum TaxID=879819 RepID=A0A0J0XYQ4_9TREE|nr:NAD-binding protein [Cutaneotrichosporon oleaginosum]KLT46178.1 NAD-binding protein [Cutaneotrichosporon oleaginosum]TXT10187.1 hypothetical protein COLE_04121 [Cutaneotrichosporon oleaginosum]